MILPSDKDDRHKVLRNLIREVERASREERRTRNRRNRQLFLTGSQDLGGATANRYLKFADDSASILYSPTFARFDVCNEPQYGDHFLEEEEAARDVLHRLWQDSEAAMAAASVVHAAHWQDTAIAKVFVDRNEPTVDLIADPSDVCVLRESVNSWDRQEVLVHFYVADLSTFARMCINEPANRFTFLMDAAEQNAIPGADTGNAGLTSAQANILLLSATPSMQGNVENLSDAAHAIPSETEPLVRLAEAWVWDDRAYPSCKTCGKHRGHTMHEYAKLAGIKGVHEYEQGEGFEGDYRVVTMLVATDDILWEPRNPLLPGKHPFHPLCLGEVPGYIWGIAPVERLIPLVTYREELLGDIRAGVRKQFRPPIVATGMQGISEEKIERLRTEDGIVSTSMPQGDAKPFQVPIPPDAFSLLEHVDRMIDELGGLPGRVTGQSDPNTRSGDHLMSGAALGAGPSLARAMKVETWVNGLATDLLRLERRVHKAPIRKHDGTEFLLAQMPGELTAVIAAHSASPIYQQQLLPKVALLLQTKSLTKEDAIELLQIPGTEARKRRARKMEEAQSKKSDEMLEAKIREILAKAAKHEADAKKI